MDSLRVPELVEDPPQRLAPAPAAFEVEHQDDDFWTRFAEALGIEFDELIRMPGKRWRSMPVVYSGSVSAGSSRTCTRGAS